MPGIVVEIIGNASQFKRELSSAIHATNKANSSMERLSKAARIAGLALAGGLAVGAKIGFDELREGQLVSAQTAAALKSTGAAANVTQAHIEDLATSLSKMSGVDDELIQSSENVLLSFTKIRNEVGKGNDIFDRATKVVLDYSARTGKDASQAALIFGKALEDPLHKSTALARAGIILSDAQKKQIAAFTAAGKPMEAQKVLLDALQVRYGGAAKAAGETLTGQLNRARESFREMAAAIVSGLLPALTVFAGILTTVGIYLQEHQALAKGIAVAFAALATVLISVGIASKIWAATQAVITAATAAWTAVQWLLNAALTANPIGIVVVAIAALVAGIILAWRHSETFRNIVTGAFNAVKTAAEAVLNFFRSNWKIIATLISGPFAPIVLLATDAFGIRSALVNAATAVIDFFRSHWKTIAVLISGPFAPLVALATNAFGVRSALVGAFAAIRTSVVGVLDDIAAGFKWLANNAGKLMDAALSGINKALGALSGPLNTFLSVLTSIKNAIAWILDKAPDIPSIHLPSIPLIGKALGGPVVAGTPYLVGEQGPELFLPNTSGTILPNVSSPSGFRGGGGSGSPINIYVSGSVVSERSLVDAIHDGLLQKQRRNGSLGF